MNGKISKENRKALIILGRDISTIDGGAEYILNFVLYKFKKKKIKTDIIFFNNKNQRKIKDKSYIGELRISNLWQMLLNIIFGKPFQCSLFLNKSNIHYENIGLTQRAYFEIIGEMKLDNNALFKANNQWYNSY